MRDVSTVFDVRVGSVVAGRYQLAARIDQGGMACVYRAIDLSLGREVAVKVMHDTLASDEQFVERFRQEAQSAALLNHPNIVTVHDWGREGSTVFMVMELVDGISLRTALDRSGAHSLQVTRHVIDGVAAALDHAHARGIVHRDVKPENVLLVPHPDGLPRVKLVDFGIARAAALHAQRVTGPGMVGTISYVAPEQLRGEEVDQRADVYALGIMAYELLTGRPAFTGETPAAVVAARYSQSVPSPGISPKVDAAIARATAVRPEHRFTSAGEMATSLGDADREVPAHLRDTQPGAGHTRLPPLPTQVLPAPAKPRRVRRGRRGGETAAPSPRKRRRWPWMVAITVLLAALAGVTAVGYVVLTPSITQVPAVDGMDLAGARAALEAAGLEPGEATDEFHDAQPGTVTGSRPPSGAEVREGTRVHLLVSKGPEMLTVPHVAGKPLEQAQQMIVEAGFVGGEVGEAHHASVPRGAVISQDPAEGQARRDSPISMVVSIGPEMVTVPEVAGRTADDARAALRSAGLTATTSQEFSETVASGQVIRSSPAAGERVVKGSSVALAVSRGPRPVPVPDLVGMSLQEARAKLSEAGLAVGNEYPVPGSGRPSGQVQGQNPPKGTEVNRGTRVDVYYAT